MKALNVFLFSNTREHMLLTVGIESSLEIQSITRKYGHGYGNEQKKESFRCHLLLSTVCKCFAGVAPSMMDTDNWTPSPKRLLNFYPLSEQSVLSPAENPRLCGFGFFCTRRIFFSLFSYISRGGTQQSLGGGSPRSLTPYPFIYHFWRDNYIKHEAQCFITRWRRVENTTRSGVFHFYWETLPLSHT